MDSEAQLVEQLEREGYVESLRLASDGRIVDGRGRSWSTDDVVIERTRRYEGMSDPDDQAIVLGLAFQEEPGGTPLRGTLVLPYGPDMTAEQVEVSRTLLLEERRDDG